MERGLLALSALTLIVGLLFISSFGVGLIGAAGVLAIWSRIAQANRQHNEKLEALAEIYKKSNT
jgi:hypothetical protein